MDSTTGDELVLNHTDLFDSNTQRVQYTLSNLMLSDSFDTFFCVANNSVELREQSFTLVVQGGWILTHFWIQFQSTYDTVPLALRHLANFIPA